MASPISNAKAVPLAVFGADIERRREVSGVTDLPRNTGDRRTSSKRALLTALDDLGAKW